MTFRAVGMPVVVLVGVAALLAVGVIDRMLVQVRLARLHAHAVRLVGASA